MKRREVVGAHDPDEMDAGAALLQKKDGLIGITRADGRFDSRDTDPRMMREASRRGEAIGQRCEIVRILERIGGTDEPPDAIKPKPAQGEQTCGPMAFMCGVEAAAKEPDF